MKPEPPPQPTLYRPQRPPIKFSCLGTKSFEARIENSVFRIRDVREVVRLKGHNDYHHLDFHTSGLFRVCYRILSRK